MSAHSFHLTYQSLFSVLVTYKETQRSITIGLNTHWPLAFDAWKLISVAFTGRATRTDRSSSQAKFARMCHMANWRKSCTKPNVPHQMYTLHRIKHSPDAQHILWGMTAFHCLRSMNCWYTCQWSECGSLLKRGSMSTSWLNKELGWHILTNIWFRHPDDCRSSQRAKEMNTDNLVLIKVWLSWPWLHQQLLSANRRRFTEVSDICSALPRFGNLLNEAQAVDQLSGLKKYL